MQSFGLHIGKTGRCQNIASSFAVDSKSSRTIASKCRHRIDQAADQDRASRNCGAKIVDANPATVLLELVLEGNIFHWQPFKLRRKRTIWQHLCVSIEKVLRFVLFNIALTRHVAPVGCGQERPVTTRQLFNHRNRLRETV
jgi:hypothetical protein